ncbi:hypothetical protein N7495_008672 [Penicillium taxi]|uniref:uncharacterized protein n=1 Tax=Penicillium taxi TaxID=168475 RepID=UPI0025458D5A|nr:uncharacterized protein N7495_008672 [Penicillium taxi]KAJ5888631.1 hypothetical protein N7495_008672 [Penicillium taxi]
MESSGYKRRKCNGIPYPYIPYADQDYGHHETANHPIFIRTVPRLLPKNILKSDSFCAESITRVDKENEQLVRSCHPTLSSRATVMVSESSFGEPVWLILSPITSPEVIYAGGRPIHYLPGHHSEYIPGLITPRSPGVYDQHFSRYINPRRFLRSTDLDSLRQLFPGAVGATVLIAGFLIILFDDIQHVHDAYSEIYPLELAGLLVHFDIARGDLTTVPFQYGLGIGARIGEENNSAGCIGLKVRLQDGSEAITTVTHGFVYCPGSSVAANVMNLIQTTLDRVKGLLVRYLPTRIRMDTTFIMHSGALTNNPVGREVLIASSHMKIGNISYSYDRPSKTKPYPHGYDHDLCLISDSALPDVSNPPGYPVVTEWADYSTALDGQDVYTVCHHANVGRWRVIEGKSDSTLFSRAVILGTGYRWNQRDHTQAVFLLWHTEPALTPANGWSGAPLCVGRPSDPIAKAAVFQNFQIPCTLPQDGNERVDAMIKAGFVLPANIKNSTILSAQETNALPRSLHPDIRVDRPIK